MISHGANSRRTDRSRYRLEFDWTGTWDPSAALSVPVAIDLLGGLLPGGWPALRNRNRALVLEGRRLLCQALEVDAPCPEGLVNFIAAVPLPGAEDPGGPSWEPDPLQEALYEQYRIEVPVSYCPPAGRRVDEEEGGAAHDAAAVPHGIAVGAWDPAHDLRAQPVEAPRIAPQVERLEGRRRSRIDGDLDIRQAFDRARLQHGLAGWSTPRVHEAGGQRCQVGDQAALDG